MTRLPTAWTRQTQTAAGCTAGRPFVVDVPLERGIVGLAPVDVEVVSAAVALHRGRSSLERLALAAAGAHGVAIAPARGDPHGIVGTRHDGPAARRGLDDLQEGRWHLERLSAHLEHRLQRANLPAPIPSAAAQPDCLGGLP